MLAVVGRFHASAGKAQEWRGHPIDGGVLLFGY